MIRRTVNESSGAAAGAAPPRRADILEDLLVTLDDLERCYERLAAVVAEEHASLRAADAPRLADAAERAAVIAAEAQALERRRIEFARRLVPEAAAVPALSEIVRDTDGEIGVRLRGRGATLRAIVERVRREQEVVAAAAAALSRHLSGILQTAHGALARAVVYERRGRVDAGAATMHAVDLRS